VYKKLDESTVKLIIIALSRRRGPTLKEVASDFGTSVSSVSQILRGLTWRQVPRPTGLPGYKH